MCTEEKATHYAGVPCRVSGGHAAVCPCLSESAKLKFMKHCVCNESDCGLISEGKILPFIITELRGSIFSDIIFNKIGQVHVT